MFEKGARPMFLDWVTDKEKALVMVHQFQHIEENENRRRQCVKVNRTGFLE